MHMLTFKDANKTHSCDLLLFLLGFKVNQLKVMYTLREELLFFWCKIRQGA